MSGVRSDTTGIPRWSSDSINKRILINLDLRGNYLCYNSRSSLVDLWMSVVGLSFFVNIRFVQNVLLTSVDFLYMRYIVPPINGSLSIYCSWCLSSDDPLLKGCRHTISIRSSYHRSRRWILTDSNILISLHSSWLVLTYSGWLVK